MKELVKETLRLTQALQGNAKTLKVSPLVAAYLAAKEAS